MKDDDRNAKHHGLGTLAIHAGQSPDPSTGAVMTPIYATSTYAQSSPGVHQGFEYSRTHNPTRFAYERCVAGAGRRHARLRVRLRPGGDLDRCWSCSTAATTSSRWTTSTAARYRLFERVRRRTRRPGFQLRRPHRPGGVRSRDQAEHQAGLDRNADQPAAEDRRHRRDRRISRSKRGLLVVGRQHLRLADPAAPAGTRRATSSCIRRPSTSTATPTWSAACWWSATTPNSPSSSPSCRTRSARVQGPFDSFLALRGLKTLHLRMQAHCENALALAQWLETHPAIEKVDLSGPGVASAPRAGEAADGRLRRHASRSACKGGLEAAQALLRTHASCSRWPSRSAAWKAWSTIRRS